jgi:hypothetical protein
VIRSLSEVQKGAVFYLITLGLALLVIVIASFFAFFEEIGWRGYMLPKLETGYPRLAPALVGFLHGVWHLPLMLLTTAYNRVGNRFIVVPLFLGVLAGTTVAQNPSLAAYLTGETGIFTLLAIVIVAWVLVRRPATGQERRLVRRSDLVKITASWQIGLSTESSWRCWKRRISAGWCDSGRCTPRTHLYGSATNAPATFSKMIWTPATYGCSRR